MIQKELSVIIPLYNCEKYISNALDSLLCQNVALEIIVVDDGSYDKGPDIVQQYMKKYDFIYLYKQKNKGPSSARNLGLKYASGQYIYFMDADDFLKTNTLGQAIDYLKSEQAQIASFRPIIIPEKDITKHLFQPCNNLFLSKKFSGIEYIEQSKALAGITLIRHVISSDLIKKNNVKLNDSLFLEEDYAFLFELLLNTSDIIVLEGDRPYHWVKRLSSSSNSINNRALHSYKALVLHYSKLLTDNRLLASQKVRKYIIYRQTNAIQTYLLALAKNYSIKDLKEAISYFKSINTYPFNGFTTLHLYRLWKLAGGLKAYVNYLVVNISTLLLLYKRIHG